MRWRIPPHRYYATHATGTAWIPVTLPLPTRYVPGPVGWFDILPHYATAPADMPLRVLLVYHYTRPHTAYRCRGSSTFYLPGLRVRGSACVLVHPVHRARFTTRTVPPHAPRGSCRGYRLDSGLNGGSTVPHRVGSSFFCLHLQFG